MKRLSVWFSFVLILALATGALADDNGDWHERVQVNGWLDARILMYENFTPENDNFDDITGSDVYVYKAALGVEAEPADYVMGVINLLYEEQPDTGIIAKPTEELSVDEAYVKFSLFWLYFQVGKFYLPVSPYRPLSTSDALTYVLGETNQSAYEVGLDSDYFTLSFSGFNGGNDLLDGDNAIDDWVARLDIKPLSWLPNYDLVLGGSYLSDATETEFGLNNLLAGDYEDNVAGWTAFMTADLNFMDNFGLKVLWEMVNSMEFDEANYVDTNGDATAVSAMNAEMAFVVYKNFWFGPKYDSVSGLDWLGAEVYENPGEDEYQATSYSRFGGFLGIGSKDKIAVAFEYLHGADNETNTTDAVTMQVLLNY